MHGNDRTVSQRWGLRDLRPGSAFHELVALPTFLPAAAQPYKLPGMCPGTSALDSLPWVQPMLQSMCPENGMNISSFNLALAYVTNT